VLRKKNNGIMEYWNIGRMEWWNNGENGEAGSKGQRAGR